MSVNNIVSYIQRKNMKIYGIKNNVYDAVDSIVKYGVVAVEGTKGPAEEYANKIIKWLRVYTDISPTIGYQNVPNYGYLYYVYDLNRFGNSNSDLENIISKLDKINA